MSHELVKINCPGPPASSLQASKPLSMTQAIHSNDALLWQCKDGHTLKVFLFRTAANDG